MSIPGFVFDPVHRPCRCRSCVYKRMLRLLADLDREFGPEQEPDSEFPQQKETIQ